MMWVVLTWNALLLFATVRALLTAWRKRAEGDIGDGVAHEERLLLREDEWHWWLAFVMNGVLLSIGVAALFAPESPDPVVTWQDAYSIYAFLLFAVLLNVRIEMHGFFYRQRNGIDLFGHPRR